MQFGVLPDRPELPPAMREVRFEPVRADGARVWRVHVDDHRFGGVSALALSGKEFLALTDSGVLIRLPKPGAGDRALLRDLPDGPGPPMYKRTRDSEALAADPAGRGWWVAFEHKHTLWLYDPAFSRVLDKMELKRGWSVNKGVEAIIPLGDGLLVLPETDRRPLRIDSRGLGIGRLSAGPGEIADAMRLADGRIIVLVRRIGLTGINNLVAELQGRWPDYRLLTIRTLPIGPLNNAEAIAAEPLPSGATRLWIMTDSDFSTVRPTLLVAVDLPPRR